jgi:H+/Cl- antiporter ClcA
MPFRWNPREQLSLCVYVLKWALIAIPVGALIGSAVALFLWSLEAATDFRHQHPWLLFLLPLGGVGIGLMYHLLGRSVEGGNNLIVDEIHEPGGGIPARMAPLVLIGTVVTHFFGGSAGREGTAVQMGGSIASTICRRLKMNPADTRQLLTAGVAGGFGAVFGTPLTGAVFAVEVLALGKMSYEAIVPCLIASIVGNWVTQAWGIHHTQYAIASFAHRNLIHSVPHMSWAILGKVALAAVAFGLAGLIFAELAHGLGRIFKRLVPSPFLRPALGGALVIALALIVGRDYLGLGVTLNPDSRVSLLTCFHAGGATPWSWWWKILFTAVTLSSGFKGGEVTPLFFIGAALGNTMAWLLHAPVDLFAGLGFVAVFAGATNTPLACTIMGIELFASGPAGLFSGGFVVYLAVACFLAYLFSGHSGIYLSQRIGTPKINGMELPPDASLRTARELQPALGQGLVEHVRSRLLYHEPETFMKHNGHSNQGDLIMPHNHKVISREIGQVRIYMTPREKRKNAGPRGLRGLFNRPLYQEIIDAAKADGILNAVAHHTHYGYSGQGKIQSNGHELPNSAINLCVELIADRAQLELFCRKHGNLIRGKVIVYKHMEHWDIHHHQIEATDAAVDELDADVMDEPPTGLEGQ